MYKLEYLPAARKDLVEIAIYISHELKNPRAAERLTNALIEKCEQLCEIPYQNPVYTPVRALKYEYRKAIVNHHLIFYWVDETKKIITIARVLYARRDYEQILK